MRNRLIIDGNAVYEIDDECVKRKPAGRAGAGEESEAVIYRRLPGAHSLPGGILV